MANDYSRLSEEANIYDVLMHLGIQARQKGNKYFISCPLPEHADNTPSCFFSMGDNACYCATCSKQIFALPMIQAVTGCSFGEACDTLWEWEGRPDWFYDDSYKTKGKGKNATPQKKLFALTSDEMALINLKLPNKILQTQNAVQYNVGKKKNCELSVWKDDYLVSEVSYIPWMELMSETEFVQLVLNKVKVRMEEVLENGKVFTQIEESMIRGGLSKEQVESSPNHLLLESYRVTYKALVKLYNKAGLYLQESKG